MALGPDFQLRDVYNPTNVTDLAKRIKKIWAKFDQNAFKKAILPTLNTLDFGERSALIRRSLEIHLPEDFRKAASILVDSLAPELESESIDADWNSFINIPTAEYISYNGHDHFDTSMNALYEITKRFSSEFSIRSFLDKDSKRALSLMKKWTRDKNMHVRRLVSEGSRPRLPLGMALRKFKKDPRPVIELLELLKDDSELYVRRSVANNLNDISKDNPILS
ncbi:MAG: hypothetical protein JKX97_03730 [Candidatus Lindowbacteria bacterium]|nr:hypothetical protein [Candidatus Lindowbacteria bacterium]